MYVLLIYVFNFILSKKQFRFLCLCNSQVNLVIKGNGDQQILSNNFEIPSNNDFHVLVNGISGNGNCKKKCNLVGDKNNINIIFNNPIKSCSNMFLEIKNLIEIDLSKFDSSKLEIMSSMFSYCDNLEKINFGNINTSLVTNMRSLFNGCYNLKYLDLSNFDTSRVTDMGYMFNDCKSLMNLDLSNFDTSRITDMGKYV